MNFEIVDSLKVNFEIDFARFDCGFSEINEYFRKDALTIQANHQTKLYLVIEENQLIGFFSLTNDKITFDDVASETSWSLFIRQYFPKRPDLFSVPSIKIGYMGVDLNYQNKGLGCEIINYIIKKIIPSSIGGCRFLTVDSYKQAFSFYLKNDFQFISVADQDFDTRLMIFDLKPNALY